MPSTQHTFERSTKYGKIYNKKNNYEAMAQIYKSSNNCKVAGQPQVGPNTSKSVDKPSKKYTYNNNNMSLEKHHNKDILMKTEAKGFFIEGSEDKLSAYNDNVSKKSTEMTWQSTNQLPFLLMGQSNGQSATQENNTHRKRTSKESQVRKPQVFIQKQTFNIKQIINKR